MNVLLVHAHPEPKSFCAALRDTGRADLLRLGHQVEDSDLYAERFDPVGGRGDFRHAVDPAFFKYQKEQVHAAKNATFSDDIRREMARVDRADLVIFTFPLWWFSVPAILKGWFDRVFAMGYAYGGGRWFEYGPFMGKRAMLAFMAGAPKVRYTQGAMFGDIGHVLYPLHVGIMNLTGFAVMAPFIAWAPARIGQQEREAVLERWRARLAGLAQETPLPMHTLVEHPDPYEAVAARQDVALGITPRRAP